MLTTTFYPIFVDKGEQSTSVDRAAVNIEDSAMQAGDSYSVKVSLRGRINGTINGTPVTGFGSVTYTTTYAHGQAPVTSKKAVGVDAQDLDLGGAGALVYIATGDSDCNMNYAIQGAPMGAVKNANNDLISVAGNARKSLNADSAGDKLIFSWKGLTVAAGWTQEEAEDAFCRLCDEVADHIPYYGDWAGAKAAVEGLGWDFTAMGAGACESLGDGSGCQCSSTGTNCLTAWQDGE